MRTVLLILAASSAIGAASAAELTAAQAAAVIDGCIAHSTAKNQSHAIAVVDGGGRLSAFVRMQGNRAGIGDFAIEKAQAAALWGFSTDGMEKAAAGTPGFARAPHVVTVAGGAPIYSADGRLLLGAVGVSGEAPADDAACGAAGIAAAGLLGERKRE